MIGKKVRVFWPVDESWYTGTVQEYDPVKGEHCLQYPDGDTEWVKIGEIIAASNANNAASSGSGTSPSMSGGGGNPMAPIPPEQPSGDHLSSSSMPPDDRSKGWHAGGDPSSMSGGGGGPYASYGSSYPPPPPGSGYPPSSYHGMGPPPPHYAMPYPPGPSSYYNPYGPSAASALPYSDRDNSPDGGARAGRKSGPKPWTKEEDALLMNLVHTMQWPMKWTVVAQSLPDRTGKQCRERYVNHLNPRLKNTDWTPVEDATIFHLYNTIGSHWAKMSKVIPGRTDNGIKNRFHNIRRQYEREDTHRIRLSTVVEHPEEVRLDRLRKFPEHLTGKSTELWEMKQAVGVLAAQSVKGAPKASPGRFGPFRPPGEDDVCVRCGMMVPSVQTGDEICTKTGWCQSCTRIPPSISGNLLRECLNLRRCADRDTRDVIESWEEFFVPDAENAWPYSLSSRC